MQLNVVLLNSLIKAINHMYDILIIRVEFGMLLLAIRSVSFEGVSALDLPHKMNRFFYFLALFCNKNKSFYFTTLERKLSSFNFKSLFGFRFSNRLKSSLFSSSPNITFPFNFTIPRCLLAFCHAILGLIK